MMAETLYTILKPIKNMDCIAFFPGRIAFVSEGMVIKGEIRIDHKFPKAYIAYVKDFVEILEDVTGELKIRGDVITNDSGDFEFQLYEYMFDEFNIREPNTVYDGLKVPIKPKCDEVSFEPSGTFAVSITKYFKKKINSNQHKGEYKISYDKLKMMPKGEYKYGFIGESFIAIGEIEGYKMLIETEVDSFTDSSIASSLDDYINSL